MESGDENTKKIQAFVKGRKQKNTIWELRNENYDQVYTFKEMTKIGKYYYENMLKAYRQNTTAEVIYISQFFPESISDEDNSDLMEEVSEEELKATLHSFQKDKILGRMAGPLNSSW